MNKDVSCEGEERQGLEGGGCGRQVPSDYNSNDKVQALIISHAPNHKLHTKHGRNNTHSFCIPALTSTAVQSIIVSNVFQRHTSHGFRLCSTSYATPTTGFNIVRACTDCVVSPGDPWDSWSAQFPTTTVPIQGIIISRSPTIL